MNNLIEQLTELHKYPVSYRHSMNNNKELLSEKEYFAQKQKKQVALTIIDQIETWYNPYAKSKGINYAMATMGAHNMSYGENCLKFKVKGNRKINTVVITLNAMDTYDVEFHLCKILTREPYIINNKISEHKDIYTEQLGPLLKEELGLL